MSSQGLGASIKAMMTASSPKEPCSVLTPRDIIRTGKLSKGIWVIGTVVRVRETNHPVGWSGDATSGKDPPKGKSALYTSKARGDKKQTRHNEGLEIYLNGGDTPADVVVLTAWEEKARQSLAPFFKTSTNIMISSVFFKEHSDKSSLWVSSRHALCGIIDPASEVREYTGEVNWLTYHPITPLLSLKNLPDQTFVCIAGLVLSPGPVQKVEQIEGQPVSITNFQIRTKDGIVKVEAWRDIADYAASVEGGKIYLFEGIKKVNPDKSNLNLSTVRYQKTTTHSSCEESLEKKIRSETEDSGTGAEMISPIMSGRSKKDAYKTQNADWVSLSIVGHIISGGQFRNLQGAMQVPSVFIKPSGDKITYLACATCKKGLGGSTSCQCATPEPNIRFRAALRIEDDTSSQGAVMFDALHDLIKHFADGDSEKEDPLYYHDKPENVEEFSLYLEALPCTILITLFDNNFTQKIEISVHAVEPTFNASRKTIRHPLKPILSCAPSGGRSTFCPPCAVEDTSFDEGAGVTLVCGTATKKFRALLTILDKQAKTERDDTSPAVRCMRKVSCALQSEKEMGAYTITSVGAISFATHLMVPRKGEILHATVAWRNKNELALWAFMIVGENAEATNAFKSFFAKEVEIFKGSHAHPIQLDDDETPRKKHRQAMDAARELATPEPWAKRSRIE